MLRAIKIITSLTLLASACITQAFPTQQAVPGGIAIIPLNTQQSQPPVVRYEDKRVTVLEQSDGWLALVGIPLDSSAGIQEIEVNSTNGREVIQFEVAPKHYRTQRLRIKDKNKVEPDEDSSERIVQEMALQKSLASRFTGQVSTIDFIRPIAGRDSGRFGLRRILNGQQRQPHSGMDIAAPNGKPVKVVAPGKVIYTGNLFFSGNVVYVDHGGGLISMYAHLSQINVKAGELLNQGDYLGLVGSTGRATGPHLHWSVYLNGTAINPALFL
jgi:murein DD-endopeptidase MepM/ murein hydrolase activator NlpD